MLQIILRKKTLCMEDDPFWPTSVWKSLVLELWLIPMTRLLVSSSGLRIAAFASSGKSQERLHFCALDLRSSRSIFLVVIGKEDVGRQVTFAAGRLLERAKACPLRKKQRLLDFCFNCTGSAWRRCVGGLLVSQSCEVLKEWPHLFSVCLSGGVVHFYLLASVDKFYRDEW